MTRRTPIAGAKKAGVQPPRVPPEREHSLRRQKGDFTAEGAPLPGLVGDAPPAGADTETPTENVEPEGAPRKHPGHGK